MKSILFVNGCMTTESSGPYLSLKQTTENLVKQGINSLIIGTVSSNNYYAQKNWSCDTFSFKRIGPDSVHYSPELRSWIKQQQLNVDVVSMQGVWLYPNSWISQWCVSKKVPFMITAHGNFNPTALKISSWKKFIARYSYMRPVFKNVKCYQALTLAEKDNMRNFGIKEPIATIGNGIDIPVKLNKNHAYEVLSEKNQGLRTCLYVGRIHPIKGLERVIKAWAQINNTEWQLIICGDGDKYYLENLISLSKQLECKNIRFEGFVNGIKKAAWFSLADFFVLPSHSEAFPMAVMEAFSYSIPALYTSTCEFSEPIQSGAAFEVNSNTQSIANGLELMISLSDDERDLMGKNALNFVAQNYSWNVICNKLVKTYEWMLDESDTPDFVDV